MNDKSERLTLANIRPWRDTMPADRQWTENIVQSRMIHEISQLRQLAEQYEQEQRVAQSKTLATDTTFWELIAHYGKYFELAFGSEKYMAARKRLVDYLDLKIATASKKMEEKLSRSAAVRDALRYRFIRKRCAVTLNGYPHTDPADIDKYVDIELENMKSGKKE